MEIRHLTTSMERGPVLLFGVLVAVLVRSAAPQQCNIAPVDRKNCGFGGITQDACNVKGCCYDENIANTIWCFEPKVTNFCPVAGTTDPRIECPYPTIPAGVLHKRFGCHKLGCCFDDSLSGLFSCFMVPTGLVVSQPALCATPPPMASRVQCGQDAIEMKQCHQDLCCYDTTSTPKCFSPVTVPCTVPVAERVDCGYPSIERKSCLDRGCCFDPGSSGIQCYFSLQDYTPATPSKSCDIGKLINDIGALVQQWIDLVTKPQTVGSVLNAGEMFSLSTYCGLYTTAIDAIIGCANVIVGPFSHLSDDFNANFLRDLNNIDNAKHICGAVMGYSTQTAFCIPESVGVCSLLSFDLLVTFTKENYNSATDTPKVCAKIVEVVRGIATCIGLSTRGCTPEQKDDFVAVRRGYIATADRMTVSCNTGCTELTLFLLDKHPTCSWNLPRLYPDPKIENYCTYARNAVVCAWNLWAKCRLLPHEYFQRAISTMRTAFFIGGCKPFESALAGFSYDTQYEVKLPECVTASISCAKELSFGVGVNEMLGPFGGYNINQVKARIYTIGSELAVGNYSGLCGNPTQRATNKNPIRDCMSGLSAKCGGSATAEQIKIVNTAAMWFDEVCVPGCTNLADKFVNFRRTCPDMQFKFDPTNIPTQILLAISPGGQNIELCRPIQHYAVCVSKIIESCQFLNNRLAQARALLISVITQGKKDLPVNIYICGLKLDYPFKLSTDRLPAFFISGATSGHVQFSWLTILCAALVLLRQT